MNSDWNWFFSSFAQSAAALLGIIAAFVISRLLGSMEKISHLSDEFETLKISHRKLQDAFAVRKFGWYNAMILKYDMDDLKTEINKGAFNCLSKQEILEKLYQSDKRLFRERETTYQAFEEIRKEYDKPYGLSSIARISPNGLWDNMRDEREKISQLTLDAREMIAKFRNNKNAFGGFSAGLHSIRIIIMILIFAFPMTVIYPLHFMPLAPNKSPLLTYDIDAIFRSIFTIRGLMLFAFLAVIEGAFFYFLFMVKKLQRQLASIMAPT